MVWNVYDEKLKAIYKKMGHNSSLNYNFFKNIVHAIGGGPFVSNVYLQNKKTILQILDKIFWTTSMHFWEGL